MSYFNSDLSATYCGDLDLIGGFSHSAQIPIQFQFQFGQLTQCSVSRRYAQCCKGVNLVWGYTWNYQLSDTVIWLWDVNRAGVWWGLRSDGDLHRADYFSIIHSQQKIITLSRASGVDWSNQIIRDGTTPTAIWLRRSWVILLGCSLLVCRCTAGCSRSEWHFWCEAFWPVSEVVYCCSDCSGKQQLPLGCERGDFRFHSSIQYSANGFFCLSTLLLRTNEPHLVKIWSNHTWQKYRIPKYLGAGARAEFASNVSGVLVLFCISPCFVFLNDIQPMSSSKVTENYLGKRTMDKAGDKEADNEDTAKKIHPAIP